MRNYIGFLLLADSILDLVETRVFDRKQELDSIVETLIFGKEKFVQNLYERYKCIKCLKLSATKRRKFIFDSISMFGKSPLKTFLRCVFESRDIYILLKE